MHALIRIPLHELGPGGPVAVERELKRITRRVTTSGMSHPTERSHRIRWGKEADTTHLDTTDAHATNRRIWYVGKALGYTAKNLAAGYDNDSMQGPAAAHLARLHTAAAEMPCGPDCDGEQTCPHRFVAPLRAFDPEKAPPGYRHKNLGASAHVMSISRPKTTVDPRTGEITTDRYGWSYTGLTREQQRQERSTWVQEQLDLGEWPTAATPKIVTEYIRDAHRFLLEAMGQAIRPRPAHNPDYCPELNSHPPPARSDGLLVVPPMPPHPHNPAAHTKNQRNHDLRAGEHAPTRGARSRSASAAGASP